jgi:hypothetical protein
MKSLSVAYGHTSMTAFPFYLGQFIYVNVLILSDHKTRGFLSVTLWPCHIYIKKVMYLKGFLKKKLSKFKYFTMQK